MMKKRTFILKENRKGGAIPEFETKVDVTLTDTDITFEFFCKNSKFFSYCEGYNTELCRGDVCEAYICTDGSRVNYYEIQVAMNNSNFFSKVYNPDGNFKGTFIDVNPITSEVERLGNDYRAKFSLPLKAINYDEKKGVLLNIFRIETEGGTQDKNLLALNPTLQNTYHRPEFFIEL